MNAETVDDDSLFFIGSRNKRRKKKGVKIKCEGAGGTFANGKPVRLSPINFTPLFKFWVYGSTSNQSNINNLNKHYEASTGGFESPFSPQWVFHNAYLRSIKKETIHNEI